MSALFWLSLVTLLYIYAGYPLLVWVLARVFGREPASRDVTPTVSLLLPAHNEAAHIERKLRNSLALDYPKDKLEIVVASDGSTDGTDAIVRSFEAQGVKLFAMRDHLGKSAMLSRVVPLVRGEVVVFSDATIELEPHALRALVRHFADPRIGGVSGAYRLQAGGDLRSQGEGLYWRYEAFIKRQESRLHSVLGAHGPCYAVRKELFQRLGDSEINDDYLVPMRIVAQGYRVVYEPEAVTWERELVSVEGEMARRRRIAAGNCQQIAVLAPLLHPRHGWVAFCFFSHKVLRTLAPFVMLIVLVASFWLSPPLAAAALAGQAALYASAFAGYMSHQRGRPVRLFSPPFYFCLGNLAMFVGVIRFCFSRRRYTWERAR